jgi:hypothetical protein
MDKYRNVSDKIDEQDKVRYFQSIRIVIVPRLFEEKRGI